MHSRHPLALALTLALTACAAGPEAIDMTGEACTVPGGLFGNECNVRGSSLGDCTTTADCAADQTCARVGEVTVCVQNVDDEGACPDGYDLATIVEAETETSLTGCSLERSVYFCGTDNVCARLEG